MILARKLPRFLACAGLSFGQLELARAESAFGDSHGTVERVKDPHGESKGGDGVYGRFNGDVSLQIGAGAEVDFRVPIVRPLITADVFFYQTLGIYGSYRQAVATDDPLERIVSLGIGVSPLFFIRFPRAWESGAAFWDLTLDSLTITAGAQAAQPVDGSLFDEVRAELGLQGGVPLLGRANGIWLRARGQLITDQKVGASAWLWLSYQGFVHAGILGVD